MQHIWTAPKDGTKILIAGNIVYIAAKWSVRNSMWVGKYYFNTIPIDDYPLKFCHPQLWEPFNSDRLETHCAIDDSQRVQWDTPSGWIRFEDVV